MTAQPTENKERSDLQNRVDPWGKLHVANELGAWMGNRGILHDDQKQIIRPWQHNGWVTCRLDYGESTRKGSTAREKLFTPGNYSELFFLDEATAFAAGHRPCAQCRNKRYKEFKTAWINANGYLVEDSDPSIKVIDRILQNERTDGNGKRSIDSVIEGLPDGTMIDLNGSAYLVWRERLYRWSFAGYEEDKGKRPPTATAKVLTPMSIVLMYANGFIPQVHVSAFW